MVINEGWFSKLFFEGLRPAKGVHQPAVFLIFCVMRFDQKTTVWNPGSALDFFRTIIGWKHSFFFLGSHGWLLMRGGFQSYYSEAEASKRGASASFVVGSFCNDM